MGEVRYATNEGGERHTWDPSRFNNNGMGTTRMRKTKAWRGIDRLVEDMF